MANGNNKVSNTTAATINNVKNTIKNTIKNTYNKTSTSERIIYLICTIVLIGLIIYWGFYLYKYYTINKKYYTLVSRYSKINAQNKSTPVQVYPSQIGNQFTISMWVKINSLGNTNNTNAGKTMVSVYDQVTNDFVQLSVGDETARNNIVCNVKTSSNTYEKCVLSNVPLYTWVQLVYVFNNRYIDIYGNGKLLKSCYLAGIPKYPSGIYKIMIGDDNNKEVDMDIYNLEYYGKRLMVNEVDSLYENRPNMEIISKYKV
jgi:hypothetical protein